MVILFMLAPGAGAEEKKKESCAGHKVGEGAEYEPIKASKEKCETVHEILGNAREQVTLVKSQLKTQGDSFGFYSNSAVSAQTALGNTKAMMEKSVADLEAGNKRLGTISETVGKAADVSAKYQAGLIKGRSGISEQVTSLKRILDNEVPKLQQLETAINKNRTAAAGGNNIAQANLPMMEARYAPLKKDVEEKRQKHEKLQKVVNDYGGAIKDQDAAKEASHKVSGEIDEEKKKIASSISDLKTKIAKLDETKLGASDEKTADAKKEDESKTPEQRKAAADAKAMEGMSGDPAMKGEGEMKERPSGKTASESEKRLEAVAKDSQDAAALETGIEQGKASGKYASRAENGAGTNVAQETLTGINKSRDAQEENYKSLGGASGVSNEMREHVKAIDEIDRKLEAVPSFEKGKPPAEVTELLEQRKALTDSIAAQPALAAEARSLGITERTLKNAQNDGYSATYDAASLEASQMSGDLQPTGYTHEKFMKGSASPDALGKVLSPDYEQTVASNHLNEIGKLDGQVKQAAAQGDSYGNKVANSAQSALIANSSLYAESGHVGGDVYTEQDMKTQALADISKEQAFGAGKAAARSQDAQMNEHADAITLGTNQQTVQRTAEGAVGLLPGGSVLDLKNAQTDLNRAEMDASASGYDRRLVERENEKRFDRNLAVAGVGADALGGTVVTGVAKGGKAAMKGVDAMTSSVFKSSAEVVTHAPIAEAARIVPAETTVVSSRLGNSFEEVGTSVGRSAPDTTVVARQADDFASSGRATGRLGESQEARTISRTPEVRAVEAPPVSHTIEAPAARTLEPPVARVNNAPPEAARLIDPPPASVVRAAENDVDNVVDLGSRRKPTVETPSRPAADNDNFQWREPPRQVANGGWAAPTVTEGANYSGGLAKAFAPLAENSAPAVTRAPTRTIASLPPDSPPTYSLGRVSSSPSPGRSAGGGSFSGGGTTQAISREATDASRASAMRTLQGEGLSEASAKKVLEQPNAAKVAEQIQADPNASRLPLAAQSRLADKANAVRTQYQTAARAAAPAEVAPSLASSSQAAGRSVIARAEEAPVSASARSAAPAGTRSPASAAEASAYNPYAASSSPAPHRPLSGYDRYGSGAGRTEARAVAEGAAPAVGHLVENEAGAAAKALTPEPRAISDAQKKIAGKLDVDPRLHDLLVNPKEYEEGREAFYKAMGANTPEARRELSRTGAYNRFLGKQESFKELDQAATAQAEALARTRAKIKEIAEAERAAPKAASSAPTPVKSPMQDWPHGTDNFWSQASRGRVEDWLDKAAPGKVAELKKANLGPDRLESDLPWSGDRSRIRSRVVADGEVNTDIATTAKKMRIESYEKALLAEARRVESGGASVARRAEVAESASIRPQDSPLKPSELQAMRKRHDLPEYLTDASRSDADTVRAVIDNHVADEYATRLNRAGTDYKDAAKFPDAPRKKLPSAYDGDLEKLQREARNREMPKVEAFQKELKAAEGKLEARTLAKADEFAPAASRRLSQDVDEVLAEGRRAKKEIGADGFSRPEKKGFLERIFGSKKPSYNDKQAYANWLKDSYTQKEIGNWGRAEQKQINLARDNVENRQQALHRFIDDHENVPLTRADKDFVLAESKALAEEQRELLARVGRPNVEVVKLKAERMGDITVPERYALRSVHPSAEEIAKDPNWTKLGASGNKSINSFLKNSGGKVDLLIDPISIRMYKSGGGYLPETKTLVLRKVESSSSRIESNLVYLHEIRHAKRDVDLLNLETKAARLYRGDSELAMLGDDDLLKIARKEGKREWLDKFEIDERYESLLQRRESALQYAGEEIDDVLRKVSKDKFNGEFVAAEGKKISDFSLYTRYMSIDESTTYARGTHQAARLAEHQVFIESMLGRDAVPDILRARAGPEQGLMHVDGAVNAQRVSDQNLILARSALQHADASTGTETSRIFRTPLGHEIKVNISGGMMEAEIPIVKHGQKLGDYKVKQVALEGRHLSDSDILDRLDDGILRRRADVASARESTDRGVSILETANRRQEILDAMANPTAGPFPAASKTGASQLSPKDATLVESTQKEGWFKRFMGSASSEKKASRDAIAAGAPDPAMSPAARKKAEEIADLYRKKEIDPSRPPELQKEVDDLRGSVAKKTEDLNTKLKQWKENPTDFDLADRVTEATKKLADEQVALSKKIGRPDVETVFVKGHAEKDLVFPDRHIVRSTDVYSKADDIERAKIFADKQRGITANPAIEKFIYNTKGDVKLEIDPVGLSIRDYGGSWLEQTGTITLPNLETRAARIGTTHAVLHEIDHASTALAERDIRRSAVKQREAVQKERGVYLRKKTDDEIRAEIKTSHPNLSDKDTEDLVALNISRRENAQKAHDEFFQATAKPNSRDLEIERSRFQGMFTADEGKSLGHPIEIYDKHFQLDEPKVEGRDLIQALSANEQKVFIERALGADAVPSELSAIAANTRGIDDWVKQTQVSRQLLGDLKDSVRGYRVHDAGHSSTTFVTKHGDTVEVFTTGTKIKADLPLYRDGEKVGVFSIERPKIGTHLSADDVKTLLGTELDRSIKEVDALEKSVVGRRDRDNRWLAYEAKTAPSTKALVPSAPASARSTVVRDALKDAALGSGASAIGLAGVRLATGPSEDSNAPNLVTGMNPTREDMAAFANGNVPATWEGRIPRQIPGETTGPGRFGFNTTPPEKPISSDLDPEDFITGGNGTGGARPPAAAPKPQNAPPPKANSETPPPGPGNDGPPKNGDGKTPPDKSPPDRSPPDNTNTNLTGGGDTTKKGEGSSLSTTEGLLIGGAVLAAGGAAAYMLTKKKSDKGKNLDLKAAILAEEQRQAAASATATATSTATETAESTTTVTNTSSGTDTASGTDTSSSTATGTVTATNTATATSTSTSTSSGTSTTTGTSGAPASVKVSNTPTYTYVGASLSPVFVQLYNRDGTPSTASGVPVRITCALPVPCSFRVTSTTVNSVNGKASFERISFNDAYAAAVLRFEAEGLPTVDAPPVKVTIFNNGNGLDPGQVHRGTPRSSQ